MVAAGARPLADVDVTLEAAAAAGSGETIHAETGADGRFRVTRLASISSAATSASWLTSSSPAAPSSPSTAPTPEP